MCIQKSTLVNDILSECIEISYPIVQANLVVSDSKMSANLGLLCLLLLQQF